MPKKFIFDGVSSADMHLVIEHAPRYSTPSKKFDYVDVEGNRNFVSYSPLTGFDQYTVSYDVAFVPTNQESYYTELRAISLWLLGLNGRDNANRICKTKLIDDFEPDIYRYATYSGPVNISNFLRQGGRGTISFTVGPRRYLLEGDVGQELYVTPSVTVDYEDTATQKSATSANYKLTGLDAGDYQASTGTIVKAVFQKASDIPNNTSIEYTPRSVHDQPRLWPIRYPNDSSGSGARVPNTMIQNGESYYLEFKTSYWLIRNAPRVLTNNYMPTNPLIELTATQADSGCVITQILEGDSVGNSVTVDSWGTGKLVIDFERMLAYKPETNELMNDKVTYNQNKTIQLGNGTSTILFSPAQGVTGTIYPRWWTL